MIVTNYSSDEQSLYLVAIPLILGCGLLQLFEVVADETYHGKSKSKRVTDFVETMFALPYGIIFFATAFFVFSRVVVESGALAEFVQSYILFAEQNPLLAGPASVFASGAAVNIVNDLPAAALISETLRCDLYPELQGCLASPNSTTPQTFTVNVIVASVLVGLNIGCYLTPVGALAGLIWFSQMKKEERRQRAFHAERVRHSRMREVLGDFEPVTLPTRRDLVLYGALNFFFVGLMLGLFVPFAAFILQIFVYPAADLSNAFSAINIPGLGWTVLTGVSVILYILLRTRRVISNNKVALSHMSEIFTLLNSLTIWSFKHRIFYIVSILCGFILLSGVVLFWAEGSSASLHPDFYAAQAATMGRSVDPVNTESIADFATWFFVFFGSSYEQLQFPQSFLGQIVAAVVPLSAIAAVLYVVRNTSNESLAKLRTALGHGEISLARSSVSRSQAAIADLSKKDAAEAKRESDQSARLNRALEAVNKCKTPSTLSSKLREVERLQKALADIQKKRASIKGQMARKMDELHRNQSKLEAAEKAERDRAAREAKKLQTDLANRQAHLQAQLEQEARVLSSSLRTSQTTSYDVFISHASEDKESFVRQFAEQLQKAGLAVWYDEFSLEWGDSLRRKIDHGLANSTFGVVVLSEHFFDKPWPQEELNGIFSLQMSGASRMLPIWHKITKDEVAAHSPMLADRVAMTTSDLTINEIVQRRVDMIAKAKQRSNSGYYMQPSR